MTKDKPYQTDNPDDIAEAKAKVKLRDNQTKEDIKLLMQLPAFRRFVWWLLECSHIFGTSFTGNSETFFKEGVPDNVIDIAAQIPVLGLTHESAAIAE